VLRGRQRGRRVFDQDGAVAAIAGVAHGVLDASVRHHARHDERVDAHVTQHRVDVCAVEDAAACLAQYDLTRQGTQLVEDVGLARPRRREDAQVAVLAADVAAIGRARGNAALHNWDAGRTGALHKGLDTWHDRVDRREVWLQLVFEVMFARRAPHPIISVRVEVLHVHDEQRGRARAQVVER